MMTGAEYVHLLRDFLLVDREGGNRFAERGFAPQPMGSAESDTRRSGDCGWRSRQQSLLATMISDNGWTETYARHSKTGVRLYHPHCGLRSGDDDCCRPIAAGDTVSHRPVSLRTSSHAVSLDTRCFSRGQSLAHGVAHPAGAGRGEHAMTIGAFAARAAWQSPTKRHDAARHRRPFMSCHADRIHASPSRGSIPAAPPWNELSRMIQGMKMRMILPDNTAIEGQALDVRPDELVVNVRRTSNRRWREGPHGDSAAGRFRRRALLEAPATDTSRRGCHRCGPWRSGCSHRCCFLLGETNKISGWAALAIAIGAAAGGAMVASRIHGHSGQRVDHRDFLRRRPALIFHGWIAGLRPRGNPANSSLTTVLDILGGLRFKTGGAAAAELDREAAEHPRQALRIAGIRRLRDFDGVLELVRERAKRGGVPHRRSRRRRGDSGTAPGRRCCAPGSHPRPGVCASARCRR